MLCPPSVRNLNKRFFVRLNSVVRSCLRPYLRSRVPASPLISKRMLLSGADCGGFCIVLSITGVVVTQIALGEVDRNNRLGLSQDGFYAISGWAFLSYDLIHIYVIGVFAFWLVRSLCWEAWVGGSALIVSALADCASLGVNMFLL